MLVLYKIFMCDGHVLKQCYLYVGLLYTSVTWAPSFKMGQSHLNFCHYISSLCLLTCGSSNLWSQHNEGGMEHLLSDKQTILALVYLWHASVHCGHCGMFALKALT